MSNHPNPTVIIKKVKKSKAPHHGGAWKIAYADFVTAMMAFFMLLWLLSMLNKYELEGFTQYYQKPLKDLFVGNKSMNQNASFIPPVPQKIKQNLTRELNQIKSKLEDSLKKDPDISRYKNHLDFQIRDDGVKVIIHDLDGNPMFSLGKTDFEAYAKQITQWLSSELNKIPNKILIMGFTDSLDYQKNADYTNWELSVDRANATRRLLVKQGMDEAKVIRISGAADMGLLDKKTGENPINRRIEIIILTEKAAKKIMNQ